MPVQKYDTHPVRRPSGLMPPPAPLDGVTELRLHGVGGTTPENLLADVAPQLVAGNRIAGFFRSADAPVADDNADAQKRHVEAYSWGGLTSRSATRVFWLLLFPFALANLGGWMCTQRAWRSGWRFYLHRAVVRWAALGMTINLLLLTAMTTMDLIAYQCGAQPGCVDHWWLRWVRLGPLAAHPAGRVLAGAAVPLLVLLGLIIVAGRSVLRYEQVSPPRRVTDPTEDESRAPTPARPNVGLDDRDFWNGAGSVANLALLHVGAGVAFLGWIVAYTVRAIPLEAGLPLRWAGLATAATAAAVVALAAAALLLTRSAIRPGPAWSVLLLGLLGVACAVLLAIAQPAQAMPDGPPGSLPGMRMAVNWTYGFCIGVVLAVLLSFAVSGHQKGTFFTAGPFVAVTVGVVMLNGIGIGTTIRVADLLGNVPNPGAGTARPNPLYVFDMVYAVTPYLTLLPAAILVGFVVVEGFTLWRAERPDRRSEISAEYAGMPGPDPQTVWDHSALADSLRRRVLIRRRRAGWTAGIARARRLAWIARDVDKLLTVLAFTALGVLIYAWVGFLAYDALPYAPRWALTASTWLAAAMPLGVLVLMRQGWRGLDSRRHLGVLWDVGTFWPRAYHPFAPPSYSERAVPELQRRLWHLHDNSGRVVVAAHSQGTVLAAAALLQESSRPGDDEVGLVTFGSPLTKLYGWAFPAYFGEGVLTAARPRVWRWRNFFYDTDYIGGPVFPPDAPGAIDRRLPDPPTAWYVYGQEPPTLGRHSGYWIDPLVWQTVDEYAEGLPARVATAPETTLAPERGDGEERVAPDG